MQLYPGDGQTYVDPNTLTAGGFLNNGVQSLSYSANLPQAESQDRQAQNGSESYTFSNHHPSSDDGYPSKRQRSGSEEKAASAKEQIMTLISRAGPDEIKKVMSVLISKVTSDDVDKVLAYLSASVGLFSLQASDSENPSLRRVNGSGGSDGNGLDARSSSSGPTFPAVTFDSQLSHTQSSYPVAISSTMPGPSTNAQANWFSLPTDYGGIPKVATPESIFQTPFTGQNRTSKPSTFISPQLSYSEIDPGHQTIQNQVWGANRETLQSSTPFNSSATTARAGSSHSSPATLGVQNQQPRGIKRPSTSAFSPPPVTKPPQTRRPSTNLKKSFKSKANQIAQTQ